MTTSEKSFHDRLALALHARGVSKSELARRTQVNASTVGRWLGSTRPLPAVMTRIAGALHVHERWLTDGIGVMDKEDASEDEGDAKEPEQRSRLAETPPAVHRSRISSPLQPSGAPASINAAAARLSVAELQDMIVQVVHRMSREEEPLIKLGYLTTIKACAADLERRLAEPTK